MDDLISRAAAIDANGLDEEIRCEMCRNPMHTDRGCDGNCKYDEKLYERIMQILCERIKPLPSAQPIIRCKDCKHYEPHVPCVGGEYSGCNYWPNDGNDSPCEPTDFCSYAERRTNETD